MAQGSCSHPKGQEEEEWRMLVLSQHFIDLFILSLYDMLPTSHRIEPNMLGSGLLPPLDPFWKYAQKNLEECPTTFLCSSKDSQVDDTDQPSGPTKVIVCRQLGRIR